jgi:subfamily B ATP-binding cassette protein MsbA
MSKSDATKPTAMPQLSSQTNRGMLHLVLELVQPYRRWLMVVFAAMLVETAMSLAAPWPLKIIIDNVVGRHKLPELLSWLRDFSFGEQTIREWGQACKAANLMISIPHGTQTPPPLSRRPLSCNPARQCPAGYLYRR